MLMKKKALLATALTSATFVALIAPDAAWAAPNRSIDGCNRARLGKSYAVRRRRYRLRYR